MWSDNCELLLSAEHTISAAQSLFKEIERNSNLFYSPNGQHRDETPRINAAICGLKLARDALLESIYTLQSIDIHTASVGDILTARKNIILHNDALCASNFKVFDELRSCNISIELPDAISEEST